MQTPIIGLYRKRKARKMIRQMIHAAYDKRFDPESGYCYYINLKTQEVKWEKPVNLKSEDIKIKEDWERMV